MEGLPCCSSRYAVKILEMLDKPQVFQPWLLALHFLSLIKSLAKFSKLFGRLAKKVQSEKPWYKPSQHQAFIHWP